MAKKNKNQKTVAKVERPEGIQAPAPAPKPEKVIVPAAAKRAAAKRAAAKRAGANPAAIEWPTDTWGLCKDFRAAVVALGQRTGGFADKRELVEAHVKVALEYLEDKFASEKAIMDKQLAAQEETSEDTAGE